jgi:hypothetical protein
MEAGDDRNPQQKREPLDITPEEALRCFYLECKAGLVDPAVADEIRAKVLAMIDEFRGKTGSAFGASTLSSGGPISVVIQDVLQPVRIPKSTQTPDELVELAINRVAEACRKYWAQAKR